MSQPSTGGRVTEADRGRAAIATDTLITTAAFEQIAQTDFPLWFMNSVIVTVFVTLGRVVLDLLARLKYRGRDAVFTAILAVMAVRGVVLLIPKFLVLNYLGIYNTYPRSSCRCSSMRPGVHQGAVLRVDLTLGRGGRAHRRGGHVPDLLVDRAADGPSGRHHPDDPVVPGVVERTGALHHRHRRPEALHADSRRGAADLRGPRLREPVPDFDGRGAADDHPDGPGVHRLQRYFTQGANAGAEKG